MPPAAQQELANTKRAKAELDSRVAALEAQLQQSNAARDALETKTAELQDALEVRQPSQQLSTAAGAVSFSCRAPDYTLRPRPLLRASSFVLFPLYVSMRPSPGIEG